MQSGERYKYENMQLYTRENMFKVVLYLFNYASNVSQTIANARSALLSSSSYWMLPRRRMVLPLDGWLAVVAEMQSSHDLLPVEWKH